MITINCPCFYVVVFLVWMLYLTITGYNYSMLLWSLICISSCSDNLHMLYVSCIDTIVFNILGWRISLTNHITGCVRFEQCISYYWSCIWCKKVHLILSVFVVLQVRLICLGELNNNTAWAQWVDDARCKVHCVKCHIICHDGRQQRSALTAGHSPLDQAAAAWSLFCCTC